MPWLLIALLASQALVNFELHRRCHKLEESLGKH